MKKIMLLIILSFLTSCAAGNWNHQSGKNSNLNFDKGYCRSFANSKTPTYLCRNLFYCNPDEWSEVIVSMAQNNSNYDHCMYKKGYNYK